ncbi:MAG: hypothetical protein ACTSYD_08540 [Candidatus Heimdallarchaeaceae archaeon]
MYVEMSNETEEMDFKYKPLEDRMFLAYLTPTKVVYGNGKTEFYYDIIFDKLKEQEFEIKNGNISGYFKVEYTRKFFMLQYGLEIKNIEKIRQEEITVIMNNILIQYDIETGLLASFELKRKMQDNNETKSAQFVFKSTTLGIYAGFKNIILTTTLVVIGTLSLRHKRKEAKNKGYSVKDLL